KSGFDYLLDALTTKYEEQYADDLGIGLMGNPAIHVSSWVDTPELLLKELQKAADTMKEDSVELITSAIRDSSRDHPLQSIEQTLDSSPNSFWSSKGYEDPDTGDFLEYELVEPFNLIHQFIIRPFKASFQRGMPIYAPKFVSISVGLDKDTIYYSSPMYGCINVNEDICFTLPHLVIGKFVRINFFGRQQTQPTDNLYYTVMQSVKVRGLTFDDVKEFPTMLRACLKLRCLLGEAFGQETSDTVSFSANSGQSRPKRSEVISAVKHLLAEKGWKKAAAYIAKTIPKDSGLRGGADWLEYYRNPARQAKAESPEDSIESETDSTDFATEDYHLPNADHDPELYYLQCLVGMDKDFNDEEAIDMTEAVADAFQAVDIRIATLIYRELGIVDKIIDCCIPLGNYTDIVRLMQTASLNEHLSIAEKITKKKGKKDAVKYLTKLREHRPEAFDHVIVGLHIVESSIPQDRVQEVLIAWSA
ncbi:hypothetical protein HDV05_005613, partial [Chytridiales sp. JEL 0842]